MPVGSKKGKSISFKGPPLNEKTIDVPYIKQEQAEWCWAACPEMILRYYGESDIQQCELANELFSRDDCCSEHPNPDCNCCCSVENVSDLYSSKCIHSKFVGEEVSFLKLQSEIDADRPIEICLFEIDKMHGHLVIIHGWRIVDGEEFVRVHDPSPSNTGNPSRIIAYSELLKAYDSERKWCYTWVD